MEKLKTVDSNYMNVLAVGVRPENLPHGKARSGLQSQLGTPRRATNQSEILRYPPKSKKGPPIIVSNRGTSQGSARNNATEQPYKQSECSENIQATGVAIQPIKIKPIKRGPTPPLRSVSQGRRVRSKGNNQPDIDKSDQKLMGQFLAQSKKLEDYMQKETKSRRNSIEIPSQINQDLNFINKKESDDSPDEFKTKVFPTDYGNLQPVKVQIIKDSGNDLATPGSKALQADATRSDVKSLLFNSALRIGGGGLDSPRTSPERVGSQLDRHLESDQATKAIINLKRVDDENFVTDNLQKEPSLTEMIHTDPLYTTNVSRAQGSVDVSGGPASKSNTADARESASRQKQMKTEEDSLDQYSQRQAYMESFDNQNLNSDFEKTEQIMNNLKLKDIHRINGPQHRHQKPSPHSTNHIKNLINSRKLSNLVQIDQHREDIIAGLEIQRQKAAFLQLQRQKKSMKGIRINEHLVTLKTPTRQLKFDQQAARLDNKFDQLQIQLGSKGERLEQIRHQKDFLKMQKVKRIQEKRSQSQIQKEAPTNFLKIQRPDRPKFQIDISKVTDYGNKQIFVNDFKEKQSKLIEDHPEPQDSPNKMAINHAQYLEKNQSKEDSRLLSKKDLQKESESNLFSNDNLKAQCQVPPKPNTHVDQTEVSNSSIRELNKPLSEQKATVQDPKKKAIITISKQRDSIDTMAIDSFHHQTGGESFHFPSTMTHQEWQNEKQQAAFNNESIQMQQLTANFKQMQNDMNQAQQTTFQGPFSSEETERQSPKVLYKLPMNIQYSLIPPQSEIVKEYHRQQDQKRRELRDYAAFLTENASLSSNPYRAKVMRNKQYYRNKIDYQSWFKTRQGQRSRTVTAPDQELERFKSKIKDQIEDIIVTNSPPIGYKQAFNYQQTHTTKQYGGPKVRQAKRKGNSPTIKDHLSQKTSPRTMESPALRVETQNDEDSKELIQVSQVENHARFDNQQQCESPDIRAQMQNDFIWEKQTEELTSQNMNSRLGTAELKERQNLKLNLDIQVVEQEHQKQNEVKNELSTRMTNANSYNTGRPQTINPHISVDSGNQPQRIGIQDPQQVFSRHDDYKSKTNAYQSQMNQYNHYQHYQDQQLDGPFLTFRTITPSQQPNRPVTSDLPSITQNSKRTYENKNLSAIFTNQNNRSTYRAYSQLSNDFVVYGSRENQNTTRGATLGAGGTFDNKRTMSMSTNRPHRASTKREQQPSQIRTQRVTRNITPQPPGHATQLWQKFNTKLPNHYEYTAELQNIPKQQWSISHNFTMNKRKQEMKQQFLMNVNDCMTNRVKKKLDTEIVSQMTKSTREQVVDTPKKDKWDALVDDMEPYFDEDGRFDLMRYHQDQILLQKYPKSHKIAGENHREYVNVIKKMDRLILAAKQASLIPVERKFKHENFHVPHQKLMRQFFSIVGLEEQNVIIWLLAKISHLEDKQIALQDLSEKQLLEKVKDYDRILNGQLELGLKGSQLETHLNHALKILALLLSQDLTEQEGKLALKNSSFEKKEHIKKGKIDMMKILQSDLKFQLNLAKKADNVNFHEKLIKRRTILDQTRSFITNQKTPALSSMIQSKLGTPNIPSSSEVSLENKPAKKSRRDLKDIFGNDLLYLTQIYAIKDLLNEVLKPKVVKDFNVYQCLGTKLEGLHQGIFVNSILNNVQGQTNIPKLKFQKDMGLLVKPLRPNKYSNAKNVPQGFDQLGKLIDFDTIFAPNVFKHQFFATLKNPEMKLSDTTQQIATKEYFSTLNSNMQTALPPPVFTDEHRNQKTTTAAPQKSDAILTPKTEKSINFNTDEEDQDYQKPFEGPLDGCLYISEQFMTDAHAEAIESIIRGNAQEILIKRVIIDSCSLTDEQLSKIFQALLDSHSTSLTSLTISNQTIGTHSILKFQELLPLLYSFTLNNIKFDLPKRVPKQVQNPQSSQPRIVDKKPSDGTLSVNEGPHENTKSKESLKQEEVKLSLLDQHPMSQILANFQPQSDYQRSLSITQMASEVLSPVKAQNRRASILVSSPAQDLQLGKKKKSVVARRANILSLKMSGINMSQQLNNWSKVFENCLSCLMVLDLSWTQLRPQDLTKLLTTYRDQIKEAFMQSPLRDLNISYNLINGKNGSFEFASILKEFLKDAECTNSLTRLNLSGLQLSQIDILDICEIMSGASRNQNPQAKSTCNGLMSIHLSDMGLEFDQDLQKEILETFGIEDEDELNKDDILGAINKLSSNKVGGQKILIEYVPVIERAVTYFDLNLDENNDFQGKHFSQHKISASIKSCTDKFGIDNKSLKDQIIFLTRSYKLLEDDISKLNRRMSELQKGEDKIVEEINKEIEVKLQETYQNGVEKQKIKDFVKQKNKSKSEIIQENQVKKNKYKSDLIKKEKEKTEVLQKLKEVEKAEKTLQQQVIYKNQLVRAKEVKKIKQQQILNQSQFGCGNARAHYTHDSFILTRQLGFPELIWNQDTSTDRNKKKRFFEKDHSQQWTIDKDNKHSCFVSDKSKYTIIFFDRRNGGVNDDLIEIHNKEFKNQLKRQFLSDQKQSNYKNYQIDTPQICGTIVKSKYSGLKPEGKSLPKITNQMFERKLRMLRADLFTLLSICQADEFFKSPRDSEIIKNSIIKYLESEDADKLQDAAILDRLKGWNKLLHQKCNINQVVDMLAINQPEMVQKSNYLNEKYVSFEDPNRDIFVYAAFLEPGYHQFLIFDPQSERAFCKDLVVEPNNFMMFPELPKSIPALVPAKRLKSVWAKWQQDTAELQVKAFQYDIGLQRRKGKIVQYYEPERILKDPKDVQACEEILKANFRVISVNFLDMVVKSAKFPEIDIYQFKHGFQKRQKQLILENNPNRGKKMSKAQMELIFMRGTKNDNARGLNGSLCRGEFLDALLRFAHSWAIDREKVRHEEFSRKEMILSEYLQEFIDLFLLPTFKNSRIIIDRPLIQDNLYVNKILQFNAINLKKLYIMNKINRSFTLDSALKMLGFELTDEQQNKKQAEIQKALKSEPGSTYFAPLTLDIIKQCFVFSNMTVVNEAPSSAQYEHLKYIEFLEFICRLSIMINEQVEESEDEETSEEEKSNQDEGEQEEEKSSQKEEDHDYEAEDNKEKEAILKNIQGFMKQDLKKKVMKPEALEKKLFAFLKMLFDKKYAESEAIQAFLQPKVKKPECIDEDVIASCWNPEDNQLITYL